MPARFPYGMRSGHLTRAIALMEDTIESPIAPCGIGAHLGISTSQLERLFGKHLNTSPKRYMAELRLHRARNLIVQIEQPIAQIAMACGFNSTSQFPKVFRSHFEISRLRRSRTLA